MRARKIGLKRGPKALRVAQFPNMARDHAFHPLARCAGQGKERKGDISVCYMNGKLAPRGNMANGNRKL